MIRYGSVCSGIEAASVAWLPLGWRCEFVAEIDPFCSALLKHYYPGVPNLGDMTKINWSAWAGKIDVLVGGTPCQAFSVAGLRRSLADERGNLTLEFARAADIIQPRYVVWENVPGVLNTRDNAFGCFLGALAGADSPIEPVPYSNGSRWWRTSRRPIRWRLLPTGKWQTVRWRERYWPVWPRLGVVDGPKRRVAWRIRDAQWDGVAQRRERVFVVASTGDGAHPLEILLERHGLQRHTPPRREAGKGTARGFEIGPSGGGFCDVNPTFDARCKDGPIRNQLAGAVAMCLNGGGQRRFDAESETLIPCGRELAGTLKGRMRGETDDVLDTCVAIPILEAGARTGVSTDDPRAGIGVGEAGDSMYTLQSGKQHAVAFKASHYTRGKDGAPQDTAPPLSADADKGDQDTLIAFSCKDHGADAGDVAPTLRSMEYDGSHANGGGQVAVCVQEGQIGVREYDTAGTVRSDAPGSQPGGSLIRDRYAVRRLTPRECERLQGFPDDYTLIPYRGKPAADGPRYRSLGNSMAVPVMRWIGRRIMEADAVACAQDKTL